MSKTEAVHHGDDGRRPVPGIDLLQPWGLGVECTHWGELVQWGQMSTSKMQVQTREQMCPRSGSASRSCSALRQEDDDKSKDRRFMEDV